MGKVIDFNEQRRLANIEKLKEIDGNGCWDDEDAENQGWEPMTLQETIDKLNEFNKEECC